MKIIERIQNFFKKKYDTWDGTSYRELFSNIFFNHHNKLEKNIAESSFIDWNKQKYEFDLELPVFSEIAIKSTDMVNLSREKSKELLSQLKLNVLDSVKTALEKSKEVAVTGEEIKESFKDILKKQLEKNTQWYTPTVDIDQIPLSEQISQYETKTIINNMKYTYAENVANKNEHVVIKKRWNHYSYKSKVYRKGHKEVSETLHDLDFIYNVNYYTFSKAYGYELKGSDKMRHPHDNNGGHRQNRNCHCDISFEIVKRSA